MPKKFVEVVVKATKRKQFVPEHFLGDPVLGAGIELTPSARADAKKTTATTAEDKTAATVDNKEK